MLNRETKAPDFPGLICKIRKSHKHTAESTFYKIFTSTHQKGILVTINLQLLQNKALKKIFEINKSQK